MSGRKMNDNFSKLKFQLVKVNNRHAARCTICKNVIKNTGYKRLQADRNVCTMYNEVEVEENNESSSNQTISTEAISNLSSSNLKEMFIINENVVSEYRVLEDGHLELLHDGCDQMSEVEDLLACSTSNSSGFKHTPILKKTESRSSTSNNTKKRKLMTDYVDSISKDEASKIDDALARFIFGCNLPFRIVESKLFKEFVQALRPSYVNMIPSRTKLSTTLLNKCYNDCISEVQGHLGNKSVVICDGWKNSSNNTKTVVTMLHTTDGAKAFLNAWDCTTESETGEKIAKIITDCKDKYNVDIYAVVTDNASAMVKREISYSMQFGQVPAAVIQAIFLENLIHMKQVLANTTKKIKNAVKEAIFDDDFVQEVKFQIEIQEPVCNLINICQKPTTSIADAADLWLSLKLPEVFTDQLKRRQEMALNVYSLVAYYFHPSYDNDKLLSHHKNEINRFLFKHLNSDAINAWDAYNEKTELFKQLFSKNINDPLVFWRFAKMEYPNLAAIVLKLLKIPAASAQIERLFSDWGNIHSLLRNRLKFETSKKLVHVYFTLRDKSEEDSIADISWECWDWDKLDN